MLSNSLDDLYRDIGAGRGKADASSWTNSLRPRLFTEGLPVRVSEEISRRVGVRNRESRMAKLARPCMAKVFTIRLWSFR